MNNVIFPYIDLTGVKGVLIDIDNTLYHYESVHFKAINACYNLFIKNKIAELSFDGFSQLYRQKRREVIEKLKPQGACRSRLFAFQALFEELKKPQAFNLALQFEDIYWSTLIKNIKLSNHAGNFLKKCKKNGILICAVTDMQAHFQVKKLNALGVDYLIDYLVTSEEVGSEKPSEKMFQTALNKLSLSSADVIMIGDDESKDIKGAKALGIKAIKVEVEK